MGTKRRTLILGAGVTGLAAGYASGLPVYEAAEAPGGICSSYYVRPGSTQRLSQAPADGEAYRFEIGGGHWIFGGDPLVLRFIRSLTPVKTYPRRSAVYFRAEACYVPYPLQYHLAFLGEELAAQALDEMSAPTEAMPLTMAQWLEARFGPALSRRFFGPFHQRYTAGLWTEIAPQDPYKSPLDLALVRQGAQGRTTAAGYNIRFVYPEAGLDTLARKMARRGDVHYGWRVVEVDPRRKVVAFEDGREAAYNVLLSTLPLSQMTAMTGIETEQPPDPYTSVLVLNIGAVRGPRCPDHHWLYVPDSEAGYFRIGCYSNVEPAFVPQSARAAQNRVSFYVERAYPGGEKPDPDAGADYAQAVVAELQEAGFIETTEVVDPTWIEVAYTWSRPGSTWPRQAIQQLEAHDIFMVGRYGRWRFQGIAESIRDGFVAGTAFREGSDFGF